MSPKKTVTLTWTREQLQLAARCISTCLPREVLVSPFDGRQFLCPKCEAKLSPVGVAYCCQCGQCLSWEEVAPAGTQQER